MGKRGGQKKTWRKDVAKANGNVRMRGAARDEVARTNARLEEYYTGLEIFDTPEEYAQLWEALRRELPNSFRFTGAKSQARPVQQLLRDRYIPEITAIEHEGQKVLPPTPLSWYPHDLAWQMTTPKHIVRRFPPFASFQKFLVSETSVGNISRQEAVSMIPPLLMDLRPGMTVLDMCAAPGSKAAQLLEMIHVGEEECMKDAIAARGSSVSGDIQLQAGDRSDDGRATGLLIANDSDYKRAHMLTHQMKRLNSPNLIITNHDATAYPPIKLPTTKGMPQQYLRFDRILTDVPCSGDGTLRKNVNLWKDWGPGNALGLFATQLKILIRAIQLLKVDGRIVYSTCSMNPVENEAVVSAAIDRCGGLSKVAVIDCSDCLPELIRRPGLKKWNIMDKKGRVWSDYKDVEQIRTDNKDETLNNISRAMFGSVNPDFPYDRCMRVYSHAQDTGGFFITVLEKLAEVKVASEAGQVKNGTANGNSSRPAQTPAQETPIMATINEIKAKTAQDPEAKDPIGKLDALDVILPPSTDGGVVDQATVEGYSAASASTAVKRSADDATTDAFMAHKKLKVRDEVTAPMPDTEAERMVREHTPPPGAILESTRPDSAVAPAKTGNASVRVSRDRPARNGASGLHYEEPYQFLSPSHPELESIYEFYGLAETFPRDRFMVRNATGVPTRTIYYTSELNGSILKSNDQSGVKFIHSGVKMFVRQEVHNSDVCKWRIQSEGLPLLENAVRSDRSVNLYSKQTLRILLVEMFPKLDASGWARLGEIAEPLKTMGMGCCVLRVLPSSAVTESTTDGNGNTSLANGDGFEYPMILPLWRSAHSLNLMLPKEDRKAMLLRLFDEDVPLIIPTPSSKDKAHTALATMDPLTTDGPAEEVSAVQRNSSSEEESVAGDTNDA